MPQIRPVSDLRNSFAEISRVVHQSDEPVILTRNGYGDMVVLSYEVYEKLQYELGISAKLREAEIEAETTQERFLHEQFLYYRPAGRSHQFHSFLHILRSI